MARKIKFPLEMADGFKVHNGISELREHFDIDVVVKYYFSGNLERWLRDRGIGKEADAIAALNKESSDLSRQLCKILGVEADGVNDLKIDHLERLSEKEIYLRQRTNDIQVLANVRITALTQTDLDKLLDEGTETIYLYGDNFDIQLKYKNKTYIGINTPKISINAKAHKDIEDNNIKFINVILPEGLQALKDREKNEHSSMDFFERIKEKYGENEAKAEKMYLENKFEDAISIFEEEVKKGNLRAYYFLVDKNIKALGDSYRDEDYEVACRKECLKSNDPMVKMQGLYIYTNKAGGFDNKSLEKKFEKDLLKIKDELFQQALEGDPFAAFEVTSLKWEKYYEVPEDIMDKCIQVELLHKHGEGITILGCIAEDDEDYETAQKYYQMMSNLEYPEAQYYLGLLCEEGNGVEKDLNKAFKLYKLAAEKGFAGAIFKVGDCYFDDCMGIQDYSEAFKWFQKGAKKKDAACQCMLGVCYLEGHGVKQDYQKSFLLFQEASNQGDADAMFFLGECFSYGIGTRADFDKAKEWYKKAADGGSEEARNKLKEADVKDPNKRNANLLGNIHDFINNVEDDYYIEFNNLWMPGFVIGEHESSKFSINNAIRRSADEFEKKLRKQFLQFFNESSGYLQNVQKQYEVFFQATNKTYVEPYPNLREALYALDQGCQAVRSNIGYLGNELVNMAIFREIDSEVFFIPNDYFLANDSELCSYATSYAERIISNYDSYEVRSYLQSIKNNLEQLCK